MHEVKELKDRLPEVLKYYGAKENAKGNWDCIPSRHKNNHKKDLSISKINGNMVCCCHCGLKGDTFDIIGIMENLTDFHEQVKRAKEILHISDDITSHKADICKNPNTDNTDIKKIEKWLISLYQNQTAEDKIFFLNRGISEEMINKYKLCIGEYKCEKRAILPVWSNNNLVFFTARSLTDKEPKYINPSGIDIQIFNLHYLDDCKENDVIFITEGIFDAISIEQLGYKAIATNSTSNVKKLKAEIMKRDIKPFFLTAFDNDQAGENARQEFGYKSLEIIGDYKDINEWYMKDKESLANHIKNTVEQYVNEYIFEYKKNTVKYCINEFLHGISQRINTPAIQTGFIQLDKILGGGLREGLYILGAISSLGKTTFIQQIADQIAQNGEHILFFSLEMSRFELMAKSISRLTYILNKSIAKTTIDITDATRYKYYDKKDKELIKQAVTKLSKFGDNIYIHEGVGDIGVNEIRGTVKKHIDITGKKPVVIVDYLQILAPYNNRLTDKQNIDRNVLELKRISRDYKISVLGISSFNRENYSTAVNMTAFKESGAIEYSSDVLLGLQLYGVGTSDFNAETEKKRNPRRVELKILKNRNGIVGENIKFNYYPKYNFYEKTEKFGDV